MWEQFVSFIQTKQGMGVIGLVLIGGYLLYSNGMLNLNGLKQGFNWLTGRTGTTTTTTADGVAIPSRSEMMIRLDVDYSYFQHVGCKEGMEAIGVAAEHLFHDHPQPPAPATAGEAANAILDALADAMKKPAVVAESPTTETHT